MDDLTRAFYEERFENRYLTQKGNAFQDFFSSIMEKRYPGDFQRVKPWGNVGDQKNDGYLKSRRMLFQCYAPNEVQAVATIKKIEDDFQGALPYWRDYFDTWVFVHNSRDGLGPTVLKKLLDLGESNKPLKITHWGFEELHQEASDLEEADLVSLLGHAPSQRDMTGVRQATVKAVLDTISHRPPTAEADIRPVPQEKIELNSLSPDVATMLRAGMGKADLVRRYIDGQADPRLGDEIAASFTAEYRQLRGQTMSPDAIFHQLQMFAGGAELGTPDHQAGVLAVLAYLFERCDIFEREDSEAKS